MRSARSRNVPNENNWDAESNRKHRDDDDFDDSDDHDIDDDDDEKEEDTYLVGLLDDPGMTLGKHRNVMIGDRGTRPLVSSTIQFVKPQILKADLNKQFREKFDGCEYCNTTTTVYSIVSFCSICVYITNVKNTGIIPKIMGIESIALNGIYV